MRLSMRETIIFSLITIFLISIVSTQSTALADDQPGIRASEEIDLHVIEKMNMPILADATLTVTTTNDVIDDDGLCSLREAIIAANTDDAFHDCPAGNGADNIVFSSSLPQPGTFTLSITGSGEDDSLTGDLDIHGNLTITGLGAGNTILDGNVTDRVLDIHLGSRATLSGITIRNGKPPGASTGGGIKVLGLLTLSDSIVESNHPGGIYNDGGGLIFNNVSIQNNTNGYGLVNQNQAGLSFNGGQVIGNQGGGIYNSVSTANLSNISVLDNLNGGGIFSTGFSPTKLTVDHSVIENNTSSGNGAGIFNDGIGANAEVINSRITENQAEVAGGGVFNNGLMTITASTLDNNRARSGGGIDHSSTDLSLINVTLSNNQAKDNGGGLYNRGDAVLTNITLSGNTADGPSTGGNIFNDTAQLAVRNTIVANSEIDGNCFNSDGFIHSGGHNLDSGNSCEFSDPSDLVDTHPQLGPLENNGGPTPTHALLEISPAIDMGDDALCPISDQRGVPRPQGIACDIGAYEFLPDSVADLAIQKSASPNPVEVGATLTYTISIVNNGPDPAVSVSVMDILPAGVTFQSAVGVGWSCAYSTPTVTCNMTNLSVGPAEDITVIVTAPLNGGTITNNADVHAVSLDNVGTNNNASVNISVLAPPEHELFLPIIIKN